MTFAWARVALASVGLGLLAAPLSGQAGTVREAGLEAVATAADPAVYTAGLTASVRPSSRTRLALYAGGGVTGEGDGVGRAELVGHFLLNPRSLRPGLYAGGGLAGDRRGGCPRRDDTRRPQGPSFPSRRRDHEAPRRDREARAAALASGAGRAGFLRR